jgi:hypothetical protein
MTPCRHFACRMSYVTLNSDRHWINPYLCPITGTGAATPSEHGSAIRYSHTAYTTISVTILPRWGQRKNLKYHSPIIVSGLFYILYYSRIQINYNKWYFNNTDLYQSDNFSWFSHKRCIYCIFTQWPPSERPPLYRDNPSTKTAFCGTIKHNIPQNSALQKHPL